MTEAEWRDCAHPMPMLGFLRGLAPDRKLRLFVCGCFRQSPLLLSLPGGRAAIEANELRADGLLAEQDVRERAEAIDVEAADLDYDQSRVEIELALSSGDAYLATCFALNWMNRWPNTAAERWCAQVLRCLISDPFPRPTQQRADQPTGWLTAAASGLLKLFAASPFRPEDPAPKPNPGSPVLPVLSADPSWLTSTVLTLARQMYESRDFGAMPILADALQDAGCDNDDVLNHCRGPSPHVRGCWVVDLVLGKS